MSLVDTRLPYYRVVEREGVTRAACAWNRGLILLVLDRAGVARKTCGFSIRRRLERIVS